MSILSHEGKTSKTLNRHLKDYGWVQKYLTVIFIKLAEEKFKLHAQKDSTSRES
jgi:hypothetical protein